MTKTINQVLDILGVNKISGSDQIFKLVLKFYLGYDFLEKIYVMTKKQFQGNFFVEVNFCQLKKKLDEIIFLGCD